MDEMKWKDKTRNTTKNKTKMINVDDAVLMLCSDVYVCVFPIFLFVCVNHMQNKK